MRQVRDHGTVGMGECVCVQSRSRGRVQRVTYNKRSIMRLYSHHPVGFFLQDCTAEG